MILCRDKLDPVRLNTESLIITGCELTAVFLTIKRKSERLIVVSFYKPPDIRLNYRKWSVCYSRGC